MIKDYIADESKGGSLKMQKLDLIDYLFSIVCNITHKGKVYPQDLGQINFEYLTLGHLMAFMEVYQVKLPHKRKISVYKKFLTLLENAQKSKEVKDALKYLKGITEESKQLILNEIKKDDHKNYSELELILIIIRTWSIMINVLFFSVMKRDNTIMDAIRLAGSRAVTLNILFDILEQNFLEDLRSQISRNELESVFSFAYICVHCLNYNATQFLENHEYQIAEDHVKQLMEKLDIQVPDTDDTENCNYGKIQRNFENN